MWAMILGLIPFADLCHAMVISPVQFIHGTSSVHLQPDFAKDHVQSQVSHVAVSSDVRGALLRKFSPIVYLHPDDQYLPADPALTFDKYYDPLTDSMSIPSSEYGGMPLSYLETGEGDLGRGQVERRSDNLADFQHKQSLTYHTAAGAASSSNTSTDDYNDFRRPGARSGKGRVSAPVTAQARVMTKGKKAGKILLQYWYWHFFNGAQGFSVRSDYGPNRDSEGITRWEWWPLAIHNADWEHTTITLAPRNDSTKTLNDVLSGSFDEDDYELESVYYTVHSEIEDKKLDFPREDQSHPVVYSHLNSHACYAVPGDYWNKDPGFDGFVNGVLRFLSFGRIKQIKIVDIGFKQEEAIRWSDYEIYDVSDATEGDAPDWFLWKGHWGDPVDQTRPTPTPAYVPSRTSLNIMLWLLKSLGKLKKFVKPSKKAPRGPFGHWNWVSLDLLPDDWVPTERHPPSLVSIATFLFVIALSIGFLWALISCLAVLLFISTRFLARRYCRPVLLHLIGSKNASSSVLASKQVHPYSAVRTDEDYDIFDIDQEDFAVHHHHRPAPSESFETERLSSTTRGRRRRRPFEWVREQYTRWKKSII